LVHNGIDTEEFRPLPDVSCNPRRIMVTASADASLKGLRYLLQAFAGLLPRHPGLELLLVSKPQPGGRTERLIERLGIAANIRFVSGISTADMVRYYAEASIAVVPSIYEGFGLPAGEAMACGVPVVSTDGGALPEVVGDAGIIVPVRDAGALEQAIESLLQDPQRREQLAVAGRERILERFSWQVCAQAMEDYYRKVIADANR